MLPTARQKKTHQFIVLFELLCFSHCVGMITDATDNVGGRVFSCASFVSVGETVSSLFMPVLSERRLRLSNFDLTNPSTAVHPTPAPRKLPDRTRTAPSICLRPLLCVMYSHGVPAFL